MNLHEIVVIMIVAIVVFKPEHLPEVAKMLGKTMRQCKKFFSQYDVTSLSFLQRQESTQINSRLRGNDN